MPFTVTDIEHGNNETGTYKLTIKDENGETIEAVIPPKMEQTVALTIQETQARRESGLAAALGQRGVLVLDLLRSGGTDMQNPPGKRTVVIETQQLGSWGLRMPLPLIEALIADLKALLGDDPQTRH